MPLELGFFAIPVTDMKASQEFYACVMGWAFCDRDNSFAYIFSGEEMRGSLNLRSPSFRPGVDGPRMFFRAESIKEILAKVKEAGGQVVESAAIEGGDRGYQGTARDPSGNTICFWAANS